MTKKQIQDAIDQAEKTITLSDLIEGSFLYRVAKVMIQYHGNYFVNMDGIKTRIVK